MLTLSQDHQKAALYVAEQVKLHYVACINSRSMCARVTKHSAVGGLLGQQEAANSGPQLMTLIACNWLARASLA